jgi:hypothetical protein
MKQDLLKTCLKEALLAKDQQAFLAQATTKQLGISFLEYGHIFCKCELGNNEMLETRVVCKKI